jgi:hypothetical protein
MPITRPEDVGDALEEILLTNQLAIGFKYLAKYDDTLIPDYPAIYVAPGSTRTAKHGTHTFLREITTEIYVLHANMDVDRQTRIREDLAIVTRLSEVLDANRKLGDDNVVFSMISGEEPGVMNLNKNLTVVSTCITHDVELRVVFR